MNRSAAAPSTPTTTTTPSSPAAPSTARPSPIATLFPGYFALVMATGIIAIACSQQKIDWLAGLLYAIAAVAYLVLTALLTMRIVMYRREFVADVTNHTKGFSFLTVVAGTNVLGSASGIVHGWWDLAAVMWWISIPVCVGLVYTTLIALITNDHKPGLGAGINGTWFLLVVAIQSIVALGALLLARHENELFAFGLVAGFTLGIVLYLILMTLVFLRWTFYPWEPTEVDPPAWIAAGAVAISVLAGSNLLLVAPESIRIERMEGFIEGFTTMAWATATFWFPLMVLIGVWRHIVHRVPLRYHPSYWALVFPIGMYSAATFRMITATFLPELEWLPRLALAGALVAWSATMFGLAHLGVRTVRRRTGAAPA